MAGKTTDKARVVTQMQPPEVVARWLREVGSDTKIGAECRSHIEKEGLSLLVYLMFLCNPDTELEEAFENFQDQYRWYHEDMKEAQQTAVTDARFRYLRSLSAPWPLGNSPEEWVMFEREAATNYTIVPFEDRYYLFRTPPVVAPPSR